MNFKGISSSSKLYAILLIIAVAILLFTASVTFKQIKRLQDAADRVSHSLEVEMAIGNLFSHYTRMESGEFRSVILGKSISQSSWKDYKLASTASFNTLAELISDNPEQKLRLAGVEKLQDTLYKSLMSLDTSIAEGAVISQENKEKLLKISQTLEEIRGIKNKMLLEKQRIMVDRKKEYESQSYMTPRISMLIALFALGVFVLSFLKIYKHKQRIQSSEAFLDSLLQTTDNIVNYYEPIYDSSGKIADFSIVYANDCNRDYLGLEPDEIIGKSVLKVFPFLLLNGDFEAMIRSYTEQEQVEFDRQVAIPGKKMWFQSYVSPLNKGIMVTIRNFTAREEAAEKLRLLNEKLILNNRELKDTQAFLEGILRSTDNVIMSFKPIMNEAGYVVDFEYLFVNDQMERVSGDTPADLIGKNVSEINPTIFESGVFEKMVACYSEKKKVEYETSYTKNGKKLWFHGTAIRSGSSVTVTSRDISPEKNARVKLQEVNEQLQMQNSIFKDAETVASIGSYIWYLDDGSAKISDNFYKILGHVPDSFDVTFDSYRQFVHPDDHDLYHIFGKETAEIGKSEVHSYRIITKNGKIKHLFLNGRYSKKNGRPVSIGVVQDITNTVKTDEDLRARNLELNRMNAELESFNRVASHDLQEPLRKIQMFISRIIDTDLEELSPKMQEYFEKIENAAARMQSLIQNLLTYSKIDSTHQDFAQVDLNMVLEKVMADFTEEIKEIGIKIESEKLPTIQGVEFQMEQLFGNIISNALKYRNKEEDSTLIVRAEKIPRDQIAELFAKPERYYSKISFVDNGIGFSPDYANKIFEVFQRLHQRAEFTGTGIGLAICKKIVENHHGHIFATSEPGEGATFIVYLPVRN